MGKYLTSPSFNFFTFKMGIKNTHFIQYCVVRIKETKQVEFSECGHLCLLASPTKYIQNLSTFTLDISPVQTPSSCPTAHYNSLLPQLPNITSVYPLWSHWSNRYVFPIPIPRCLSFSKSKFQWSWRTMVKHGFGVPALHCFKIVLFPFSCTAPLKPTSFRFTIFPSLFAVFSSVDLWKSKC